MTCFTNFSFFYLKARLIRLMLVVNVSYVRETITQVNSCCFAMINHPDWVLQTVSRFVVFIFIL